MNLIKTWGMEKTYPESNFFNFLHKENLQCFCVVEINFDKLTKNKIAIPHCFLNRIKML